ASRQDTPWTECQPIAGHTHTLSFTHAITHYGQFRDANQPTMPVFGLGEETGVPGGNPRGTGRTCKLHTHGRGGNRTPNPGGVRQTCYPHLGYTEQQYAIGSYLCPDEEPPSVIL
ncbi:hypothetical protein QTP70_027487, partial [Hemibagrus guttatus]